MVELTPELTARMAKMAGSMFVEAETSGIASCISVLECHQAQYPVGGPQFMFAERVLKSFRDLMERVNAS